ncbi:MAG TPA: carboxypeptidase regulatory-like domain-containing protein [Pyrinomonadaceae bacterium]|nr:carboxypeptidase regulatory-like domain-containing protein [Pyrinomonadaceae bacterium]
MRPVVLLLGVVIVVLLASPTANACSCGGSGPPCESFGRASAVFAGTVIGERLNERPKGERPKIDEIDWVPRAVKFSVEQAYSGVTTTEVEVFTGRGGGDCGYGFKVGQRYLVYAYRYQDKLSTSICSRTQLFSQATEDLAFLGTLPSARPGVTIHGGISREENKKDEPLSSDVLITIEGESQRKEIRPDAEGRFRVSGLPPGKYKVTLHLPDALTTYKNEEEITVADRGCGAVGWYVTDNGRISGRVVDPNGEPIARILVGLVDPDGNPKENYVKLERTDAEGNFKFSGVPRGRYLLTINHARYPEPDDPTKAYQPSFYPGVIDKEQAQAITVGPGETVNDLMVRVPAKQAPSVLKVTVGWSDGSPVAKAAVVVTDETQGESSLSYTMSTDEQGQATVNGYIGQKLIISAGSNRRWVPNPPRNEPMERAEKVRLTLDRPTQTVHIVITKIR